MSSGMVTTLAGGHRGGDGDGGRVTEAGLDRPHRCVVGQNGNIFIADSDNHRARVVGG